MYFIVEYVHQPQKKQNTLRTCCLKPVQSEKKPCTTERPLSEEEAIISKATLKAR